MNYWFYIGKQVFFIKIKKIQELIVNIRPYLISRGVACRMHICGRKFVLVSMRALYYLYVYYILGPSKNYVTPISVIFDPPPPFVAKRNFSALSPCVTWHIIELPPLGPTSVYHAILCYICVKVFLKYRGDYYKTKKYWWMKEKDDSQEVLL